MELNIDGVEELCEACIKSKDTRIVKSKRMTSTIKRLQEIHANIWGLYDTASTSSKNHIAKKLRRLLLQIQQTDYDRISKLATMT